MLTVTCRHMPCTMSNVFLTKDICLVQGWQGGRAAQDGAEHRQQALHQALRRCSRHEAAQDICKTCGSVIACARRLVEEHDSCLLCSLDTSSTWWSRAQPVHAQSMRRPVLSTSVLRCCLTKRYSAQQAFHGS